jgi:hypothetical protein
MEKSPYAMPDDSVHIRHVNEWMKQASRFSSGELVQLFERATGALWHRAHLTLGDVTLTAVVDRVLHNATEKFPALGSLKLDPDGIDVREFRAEASRISERELRAAIQFVLVELLTVVGNLTAEILTPALHSELSNISLKDSPGKPSGKGKL